MSSVLYSLMMTCMYVAEQTLDMHESSANCIMLRAAEAARYQIKAD